MRIISERAKVTSGFGGMEGYDAELRVYDIIDGNEVELFIHANASDGRYYTVSTISYYDYLTGLSNANPGEPQYIEEYNNLEDAKNSDYYRFLIIADRLLNDITEIE